VGGGDHHASGRVEVTDGVVVHGGRAQTDVQHVPPGGPQALDQRVGDRHGDLSHVVTDHHGSLVHPVTGRHADVPGPGFVELIGVDPPDVVGLENAAHRVSSRDESRVVQRDKRVRMLPNLVRRTTA